MDQAAIQNIRHYIATMTIGLPDDVPRAKSANMVDVTKLASLPHGLVSGSNLLQFSRDIGPELRSAVALSLLAAQRVATTSQAVTTPSAWVEAHNAVLQNLGWQIEGGAYANQTLSGEYKVATLKMITRNRVPSRSGRMWLRDAPVRACTATGSNATQ